MNQETEEPVFMLEYFLNSNLINLPDMLKMSSVHRPHLWTPIAAGPCGSLAHSGGFYHLLHHSELYTFERR